MTEPAGVFTEDEANKIIRFLISQLFYVIERLAIQASTAPTERERYAVLRSQAIQAVQESNLTQLASLTGELAGMSLQGRSTDQG
jgi:hypothetical protein